MTGRSWCACDQCYRCKTRCDRHLPACARCRRQNAVCTFSGVAGVHLARAHTFLPGPTPLPSAPSSAFDAPAWSPRAGDDVHLWANSVPSPRAGDDVRLWANSVPSPPLWHGAEPAANTGYLMPAVPEPNPSDPMSSSPGDPAGPPRVDGGNMPGSGHGRRMCRCIQAILEASTVASRELDRHTGVEPPDVAAVRDAVQSTCPAFRCCVLADPTPFINMLLLVHTALACVRLALPFPATATVAGELRTRLLTTLMVLESSLACEQPFPDPCPARRTALKRIVAHLHTTSHALLHAGSSGQDRWHPSHAPPATPPHPSNHSLPLLPAPES